MSTSVRVAVVCLYTLLHCIASVEAGETIRASGKPSQVLVIYSNDILLPANVVLDSSFRGALEDLGAKVEIFSEFLGAPRFVGSENEEAFVRYLSARYSEAEPSVIVAIAPPALEVVSRHRDLFPRSIVVAGACATTDLEPYREELNFAAVPFDLYVARTVDVAMELHPDSERVYVISGASRHDRAYERVARLQLESSEHAEKLEFLVGLSLEELERRLTEAGGTRAIAIYLSVLLDGDGATHHSAEMAARLASISRIPMYGVFDTYIGTGIIGGVVPSFEDHASGLAGLVDRLLMGESVESLGSRHNVEPTLTLDDRQLQRWRIDRARIPEGAELRFGTPSLWDTHRREIVLGVSLILAQAVLIAVLLFERRRRRRAEARASSEARRLRLITDSLPALIAQIDSEGRYVFANEAYRQWWRIDPTTARGRTVEQVVGPEVFAQVQEYVVRALAGERVQYGLQTRLPDGTARDIEALYVPDIDTEGSVHGFYSLVVDVTEEKRAERENIVLQSELAHASRLSTMGELAAALAHELNQPLTAIMSNAQAAQRFVDRESPDLDEVRSILHDIVVDDRRASEVIRRLREFLRKGVVEMTSLNLNEVVHDVVRFLAERLRSEAVSLGLELDESVPPVRGDRIQLQQVLLNLMTNAIDAMSEMDVEGRRLIVMTSHAPSGEVMLSVGDSGPGIDSSALQKVFEPFYTTKRTGMGLGLPLCRTLVEAHAGRIEARKREGPGAEVALWLPAIEEK